VRAAQSASRIWVPGGFSDCQRLLVKKFFTGVDNFSGTVASRCEKMSEQALPSSYSLGGSLQLIIVLS